MDKIATVRGFEEIRVADAPGVIIKARTRIAPTAGTASALANPTKRANIIDVSLGDTPRAAATSGSVLANKSGRYKMASMHRTTKAQHDKTTMFVESTDTMEPVSRPNLLAERP